MTDRTDDLEQIALAVDESSAGLRLDRMLADTFPDYSRSFLQRLIAEGSVTVDGRPLKQNYKLESGQTVELTLPELEITDLIPEDIDVPVVYESPDLVVFDKPAGLVVHPAPGNPSGTLANAIAFRYPEITIGGSNRPGIIHRLDKETSGLIVVAKTDRGHATLTRQWAARAVEKRYVTLVAGRPESPSGTIDAPIGRDPRNRLRMAVISSGREAVTHFDVTEEFTGASLLGVQIDTGRTHQVRVHLAFIGHPVVGDPLYNPSGGALGGSGAIVRRQFLHAAMLAFDLPDGERVVLESSLPSDLDRALTRLRLDAS